MSEPNPFEAPSAALAAPRPRRRPLAGDRRRDLAGRIVAGSLLALASFVFKLRLARRELAAEPPVEPARVVPGVRILP
ncbi:MAG: hypothetical protein U0835_10715 [Isosphaeraceae bacterium]